VFGNKTSLLKTKFDVEYAGNTEITVCFHWNKNCVECTLVTVLKIWTNCAVRRYFLIRIVWIQIPPPLPRWKDGLGKRFSFRDRTNR